MKQALKLKPKFRNGIFNLCKKFFDGSEENVQSTWKKLIVTRSTVVHSAIVESAMIVKCLQQSFFAMIHRTIAYGMTMMVNVRQVIYFQIEKILDIFSLTLIVITTFLSQKLSLKNIKLNLSFGMRIYLEF